MSKKKIKKKLKPLKRLRKSSGKYLKFMYES